MLDANQPLHLSTLVFPIFQEEKDLCEKILEHRRIQELQGTLEMDEGRPVSVHEWAVSSGYPSAHQLLGALQEGRKAERMLLVGHHALLWSVADRCAYERAHRCSALF